MNGRKSRVDGAERVETDREGAAMAGEDRMTDELKIFDRTIAPLMQFEKSNNYRLNIGLFSISIDVKMVGDYATGNIGLTWARSNGQTFRGTRDEVVVAVESEARRIMRECFEIAGPPSADAVYTFRGRVLDPGTYVMR